MTQRPKVSVVIPMYRAEKFIESAVNSVLAQTFGDFELIVLDNCSDDASYSIVERMDDPRIRLFRNEENLGLNGNLNRGVELARGEYIKFLCADDVLRPDCLARMLSYAEEQDAALLYCNCDYIDEQGRYVYDRAAEKKSFTREYGEKSAKRIFLKKDRLLCCVSFLLIRNDGNIPKFVSVGGSGYNSDLVFLFDSFRATGKLFYLGERLIGLRRHAGQGTYASEDEGIFSKPLAFAEHIERTNGFRLRGGERFRFRFGVFKNGCNAFLRYRRGIPKEVRRYTLKEFGVGYYLLLGLYLPFVYVPKKAAFKIAALFRRRRPL